MYFSNVILRDFGRFFDRLGNQNKPAKNRIASNVASNNLGYHRNHPNNCTEYPRNPLVTSYNTLGTS